MNRAGIAEHENRPLGILLMLGAFFCYTGIDTQSKILAELGYHAIFITWGRLVAQVIMLAPFLVRSGLPGLRSQRIGLQVLRGLLMLSSGTLFVAGLGHLDLATMTAINFVSPFLIVILTVLFLKEHVGYHRWVAIIVGFAGALIVIRPGTAEFNIGALFAVGASAGWAGVVVITRVVTRYDSNLLTIAYGSVVGLVGASILVFEFWTGITPLAVVYMVGMGVSSTIGQFFMNGALKQASPAVLAPVNYSQLLWAAIIGMVIFGDFPDQWTWVGAAVIVATGLYIWRRERMEAQLPSRAPSHRASD